MSENQQAVVETIRRERLAVIATLVRLTGDFDLAEDCLQDAAERALVRWSADGIPDNPAAWLTVTRSGPTTIDADRTAGAGFAPTAYDTVASP